MPLVTRGVAPWHPYLSALESPGSPRISAVTRDSSNGIGRAARISFAFDFVSLPPPPPPLSSRSRPRWHSTLLTLTMLVRLVTAALSATLAHAHLAPWHKGMYCLNVRFGRHNSYCILIESRATLAPSTTTPTTLSTRFTS